MANSSQQNRHYVLAILLSFGSLALAICSILAIQLLSIAYGVGAGAQIQSAADHTNVTSILQSSAANLGSIYNMILVDYALLIVSLGMVVSSMLLYRYKANIAGNEARGYVMLHLALAVIYFLLFTINNNGLVSLSLFYLTVVYAALLLSAAVDSYAIASHYMLPRRAQRMQGNISLNPSMPYTNLLMIKDRVFSQLSGKVIIVDKHMNSVGIENLHRLMHDSFGTVKEVKILTSGEMLDSDFSRNYRDLRSEAENLGVRFDVMIMSEDDAMKQHERFVLDSSHAYKVPPFNIIHKKSEHITRINVSDARRRSEELQRGAMKYDNYVTREGRQPVP